MKFEINRPEPIPEPPTTVTVEFREEEFRVIMRVLADQGSEDDARLGINSYPVYARLAAELRDNGVSPWQFANGKECL